MTGIPALGVRFLVIPMIKESDGAGRRRGPPVARPNAEMVGRIRQATDDARCMAGWLASAADDVAKTLDHVAATRDARAQQLGCPEADHCRESANRARRKADAERLESRRLRARWDLSPG